MLYEGEENMYNKKCKDEISIKNLESSSSLNSDDKEESFEIHKNNMSLNRTSNQFKVGLNISSDSYNEKKLNQILLTETKKSTEKKNILTTFELNLMSKKNKTQNEIKHHNISQKESVLSTPDVSNSLRVDNVIQDNNVTMPIVPNDIDIDINIDKDNDKKYLQPLGAIPKYKIRSSIKMNVENQKLINLNNKSFNIEYNTCEIIAKYIFCQCCKHRKFKVKSKLHKKGKQKLHYAMDILTYIRKVQEVDILKFLLLNKDQMILFNFLSKPSVSLVSDHETIDSLIQRNNNIEINPDEVDRIHSSFNALFHQNKKSDVDMKLIDMFSSEIDNLIL
jgi:hypothetical protein